MSNAVFLQVRLDSTRLPNKALKPIMGIPAVVHAMRSLSLIPTDYHVVLTTEDSQSALADIVNNEGWDLYIGSKSDVLDRYYKASLTYEVEEIIRATGDNPLVSYEWAIKAIEQRQLKDADYCGYQGLPIGTGVEVVKASALKRAWTESTQPYHREHVMPYLYENPDKFRIHKPLVDVRYRLWNSSVTMDTQEDYDYIKKIFNSLYHKEPISFEDLQHWLIQQ
ncbi:cytidylyltransferase domain-containing protein [Spirochaeta cellobiosiphila]|uniref:cytidylyltransferase domain-containing protein n=1 Tax=Spirochaeta cellobiosiphila TaxID=504483 RepID=UPI0004138C80|nr:hypothetical protein [Spirochaeta cellobiosiphila]